MRSYRNCLEKYVEEQGFAELNATWHTYLQDVAGQLNVPFQLFHKFPTTLNGQAKEDLTEYVPNSSLISDYHRLDLKKTISVYESLIQEIILSHLTELKFEAYKHQKSFRLDSSFSKLFSHSAHYLSYAEWIENFLTVLDFKSEFKKDFLLKLKTNENYFLSAIDTFYNYRSSKKINTNYESLHSELITRTAHIDFDSHLINCDLENGWSQEVINKEESFFDGPESDELTSLNSKAKKSPIRISGTLSNLKRTKVNAPVWMDENMIQRVTSKKHSNHLSFTKIAQLEIDTHLKRIYSNFYTVEGIDLRMELQNEFSENEIQFLRNNPITVFPFYIDNHRLEFNYNDGILSISIRQKTTSVTLLGADLKIFTN